MFAIVDLVGCSSAQELVERHEGYRSCEYVDTTGHRTICFGFNLERADARSRVTAVGGDFDKVYNGGCLSHGQCVDLLSVDFKTAESNERAVFGSVCSCVEAVLVDMTYNLGKAGIEGFGTFRRYIEEKNYKAAGEHLKGTLWCRQVKSRCTDDVEQIERGCLGQKIEIELESNSTYL